jgi:hypothetical protein
MLTYSNEEKMKQQKMQQQMQTVNEFYKKIGEARKVAVEKFPLSVDDSEIKEAEIEYKRANYIYNVAKKSFSEMNNKILPKASEELMAQKMDDLEEWVDIKYSSWEKQTKKTDASEIRINPYRGAKYRNGWNEFFESWKKDKNFLSENEKLLLTKYFKKEVNERDANVIVGGLYKEGVHSMEQLIAQHNPEIITDFMEALRKVENAIEGPSNKPTSLKKGGRAPGE